MKFIQKNSACINKWLFLYKDKNKSYDIDVKNPRIQGNKNNYDNILDDLLKEQGYVCAYCMRNILSKNATIEHFIGQEYIDDTGIEKGKKEDTNYKNMLVVCLGKFCKKMIKDKETLHCDSSRSNFQSKDKPNYRPLLWISPLNIQQMKQLGFTRTGVLFYKELNIDKSTESKIEKEIRYDLSEVLNLNCKNLKENRKRVIKIIDNSLQRHNFDKKFARKELELWKEKNNSYKEYCQVAIYKLEKFLIDK